MSNSKAEEPPSFPLSSLPDDLVLRCLARVLISDYAALSRVSKRYRSLVVSHELYKTRSLMGLTEKCFYVCICIAGNSTPQWYNLRLEKSLDAKSRLIHIPSFSSHSHSSVVALDWGFYAIGGKVMTGEPTSDMWLLDCRTNTSHKLPSMQVARHSAAVGVIDGKIYVLGGCFKKYNAWAWVFEEDRVFRQHWGEVFDPKTQTWDYLPPLPHGFEFGYFDSSLAIEGKVYAAQLGSYAEQMPILYYSPNEGKWGRMDRDWIPFLRSDCVMIDKLLYCCDRLGNLYWCEPEELKWKEVKGLEDLRTCIPQSLSFRITDVEVFTSVCLSKPPSSKLGDFSENIMFFWCLVKSNIPCSELRCVEISLWRCEEGNEIRGTFEWLDSITYDNNGSRLEVLYSGFVNL